MGEEKEHQRITMKSRRETQGWHCYGTLPLHPDRACESQFPGEACGILVLSFFVPVSLLKGAASKLFPLDSSCLQHCQNLPSVDVSPHCCRGDLGGINMDKDRPVVTLDLITSRSLVSPGRQLCH